MRFFVGLHQPGDAKHVERAFISVNRLRNRQSPVPAREWIMDSGAFSTILKHGGYPYPVSEYADVIRRMRFDGNLLAAVAQDFMCEPAMLARTGLSVEDHHRLTIERYDALVAEQTGVYIMPVLQGYAPSEYAAHLRAYGDRLPPGAWVGVGSVCKRNSKPAPVEGVLRAILGCAPTYACMGSGSRPPRLDDEEIRSLLYSADSMAWSFAARYEGRDPNSVQEAIAFARRVESPRLAPQRRIPFGRPPRAAAGR